MKFAFWKQEALCDLAPQVFVAKPVVAHLASTSNFFQVWIISSGLTANCFTISISRKCIFPGITSECIGSPRS